MSEVTRTILIIGGYGVFGGRLARLLSDTTSFRLLIAGRSLEKAQKFCARYADKAEMVPLIFDRNGDLDVQLTITKADIIVDATGPFQLYGDDPYSLVKAAIRHGMHYLDLADGSDFVKGISAFDVQAKAKGVYVLSGVSSFPVLTAAVLREITDGLKVTSVNVGIAPSPYAGVGFNVVRAIASYAGKPVRLLREDKQTTGYAITEARRFTVAPPGRLPLRNRRFTLVDVPDLILVPELWPEMKSFWVGAGPVPDILHRMLSGLAWLVRLGLLPSLTPFSRLFFIAINILRWGAHRGGMIVYAEGARADGEKVTRSWHLLAEGDDGPFIPSMAIESILRKDLAGNPPAHGAGSATGAVTLSDYDALFAKRTIYTGRREITASTAPVPLYRTLLGDAWHALPEQLRVIHDVTTVKSASGTSSVERGKSPLASLAVACFRFPPAAEVCPVNVRFVAENGHELWERQFGDTRFSSVQSSGRGRSEWLMVERFGLLSFAMALVAENDRLKLVLRRWNILGLPMPLFLAPRSEASESVKNGLFHFDVRISHPLTGLIVRYRGELRPDP